MQTCPKRLVLWPPVARRSNRAMIPKGKLWAAWPTVFKGRISMSESNKTAVRVRMSTTELQQLEDFCADNGFCSRAAGARELMMRGMNAAAQESDFAQAPAVSPSIN